MVLALGVGDRTDARVNTSWTTKFASTVGLGAEQRELPATPCAGEV